MIYECQSRLFEQAQDAAAKWNFIRRLYVGLPFVSLLAHLGMLHWVYNVTFHEADAALVLLGISILLARIQPASVMSRDWLRLLRGGLPIAAVLMACGDSPPISWPMGPRLVLTPQMITIAGAYVAYVYLFAWSYALYWLGGAMTAVLMILFGPSPWQMYLFLAALWRRITAFFNWLMPSTALQWAPWPSARRSHFSASAQPSACAVPGSFRVEACCITDVFVFLNEEIPMSIPTNNSEETPASIPLEYAPPIARREALSKTAIFITAFTVALVLLGISILLSSMPGNRFHVQANRVKFASNLRQIGQAIQMYANEHNHQFPSDLATLLATEDLTPDVFTCPESSDSRAQGATTQETLADFAKPGHCSYLYFGAGMHDTDNPNFVVASEPLINHQGSGANDLFLDGHVAFFGAAEAQKIIAAATTQPTIWPPAGGRDLKISLATPKRRGRKSWLGAV